MAPYPTSLLPLFALLACGPSKDEADCYEGFERNFEGNCVASSGTPESDAETETDASADASAGTDGQRDSGQPGGGSGEADGNLGGIDDGADSDADPGDLADETGGSSGTTGSGDTGLADDSVDEPTGGDGAVDADPCEGRPTGTTVGSCAADFTLVNHEGLEVRLKDFAGDVIVLDLSSFT